jgi:hypothetical protein
MSEPGETPESASPIAFAGSTRASKSTFVTNAREIANLVNLQASLSLAVTIVISE